MFERFTDRSRKAVQLANQSAQTSGLESVSPMYLLLGLLKEGYGVAANVLRNMDINLERLKIDVVQSMANERGGPPAICRLPLSPDSLEVLRWAREEADALNHNYVGTEHLLLGLLHCAEIVSILGKYDVTTPTVREEVINLLGHGPKAVHVESKDTVIEAGTVRITTNGLGIGEVVVDGKSIKCESVSIELAAGKPDRIRLQLCSIPDVPKVYDNPKQEEST